MSENIKELLFSLCDSVCAGNVRTAADAAKAELSKYAEISEQNGNILGFTGAGKKTVMLAAHIDEVAFTVTNVDKNGFLTVAKCGGIDLRHLPSRRVVIHGKKDITGVFCSVPPHLKKGETAFDDISALKIDSLLGKDAENYISAGDTVTYAEQACSLLCDRVTAKSLDNRVGVAVLLETARRLAGKNLPVRVCFALTVMEELGTRGAVTAAYAVSPDEAVAVDVTFGDGPDVSENDCGKLSGGAMIGISPVLSKEVGLALKAAAESANAKYSTEIMSAKTGTDADVISISKSGVKTGLLSVPIRNMHTPCEVADIKDVLSAADILTQYLLNGGAADV